MKVPVRNEDRQKSYFKYYEMEMAKVPAERLEQIAQGPMKRNRKTSGR